MYTAAELFNLATMADAKEVFLSNVTMRDRKSVV